MTVTEDSVDENQETAGQLHVLPRSRAVMRMSEVQNAELAEGPPLEG